jgi:phosphatidylcholine synthase
MAWLAHLYTATGLVFGFLALLAVVAENFRAAFLWLLAAGVVDASDGWLARALRVEERLPSFSGARLDDIVDYVTYVFVPAYLLYRAGAIAPAAALPVISAILLSSAYGFASSEAKTADHFFTGFPSYWNIVALYLFLAMMPGWLNAVILLTLCGLVFVRTAYVYPSRMSTLRTVTVVGGSIWGALLLWMIWRLPDRSPRVLFLSLAFPLYYAAISLVLHRRRTHQRER